MKKVLSIVMVLVMCISLLSVPVQAERISTPWDSILSTLKGEISYTNVDATLRTDDANFVAAREAGLKSIIFKGLDYQGNQTDVFAWYGIPEGASAQNPVPAIVLVHGAASTSYTSWVQHWVDQGFAAIAVDHLGQSGTTGADMSPLSDDGYVSGPSDCGGLKQVLGMGATDTIGETTYEDADMWNYHAVADVIMANSIISNMPEVNSDKVGITGVSWGGYLSLLTSCIDDRFAFNITNYGCAYIDECDYYVTRRFSAMTEAQHADWMSKWDPSNYLSNINAPLMLVNDSVDNFFSLEAHRKTYNAIRDLGKDAYLYIKNNMTHGITAAFSVKEADAFAKNVVETGTPNFNRVGSINFVDEYNSALVMVEKASPKPKTAKVLYTIDFGNWENRTWNVSGAEITEGAEQYITANIPSLATAYYFEIEDVNGNKFTTPYVETSRSMVNLAYSNYFYDNFEMGVNDGLYYTNTNAANAEFEVAEGGACTTAYAMKLTQKDNKGTALWRDFDFENGKTYKISYYIKKSNTTKDVSESTQNNKYVTTIVGSTKYRASTVTISNDWQYVEESFTYGGETGTQIVKLMPIDNGYVSGIGLFADGDTPEFYYDDVCITEVLPETEVSVEEVISDAKYSVSDTFSAGSLSSKWSAKGIASLSVDEMVGPDGNSGVMKCTFSASGGRPNYKIDFEQGKIYQFSVWAKAAATTNIKAVGLNFYFNEKYGSETTAKAANHRTNNQITAEWQQFVYLYKHTDADTQVDFSLYQELSTTGSTTLYFDDFCVREVGVDIEDTFENSMAVWSGSNATTSVSRVKTTSAEGNASLQVNIKKDSHSPVLGNYAFEAGKTYEVSAYVKTDDVCQLDYPAVDIVHYTYDKNNSTKNVSYTETKTNTKIKLKADEKFGANENWQKFTLYYTPTQENLTDAYSYSKLYFIADNVKYPNAAETDFTYYLDNFTVKEVVNTQQAEVAISGNTLTCSTEGLSGLGYHIMQSVDGGVSYASVKSGIAGGTITYEVNPDAKYKVILITTSQSAAVSQREIRAEQVEEKVFNVLTTNITKEQLSAGIPIKVANDTDVTRSFNIFVAAYDNDCETLLSCSMEPMTAPKNGYIVAKTVSYTGDAPVVKVLLLDNNTLEPICDAIIAE